MPRPGELTRKPSSPGAARILRFCLKKSGSLSKAARDMGAVEQTLRRRLFEKQKFASKELNAALLAYGVPPEDLLAG